MKRFEVCWVFRDKCAPLRGSKCEVGLVILTVQVNPIIGRPCHLMTGLPQERRPQF